MRDPDDLFQALARSAFRRRQRLNAADLAYLRGRGMDTVLRHADEMIAARLAPAEPLNDGKQTPMRGHPVFVAQHATGTCCRGCLAKWHGIPAGRQMTDDERAHVVRVLERWLREADAAAPPDSGGAGEGAGRKTKDALEKDTGKKDDPQMGLGL
ncbi:DUF4186 domain-containing protein [Longimicrobium sp.]|uniref:DUF4186 domain-containing protein n=1 Tax=Longimicrobium sp. TaxID=2029185 RepID=UPI002E30D582|nr:DUF4186 domain-containing protein [Longimicrobium sp.]HEX6040557.1 DUF4186 domain-containing protein [Longimicrobium sp.]